MNNKNLYQEITKTIVEMLETQLEKWNMPWICLDQNGESAHNALSHNTYNGINQLLLSYMTFKNAYQKNSWLTFNQISKMGGKVVKGCKSVPIYFWSILYYQNESIIPEDVIKTMSQEEYNNRGIKKVSLLKYFPVFNISQTEGLAEEFYYVKEKNVLTDPEMDTRAEQFIKETGAEIQYKAGDRAFYSPINDSIVLPFREQFKSQTAYYDTVLHELGHWTGHPKRMNRELHNKFGSENYAFEELVAELFSAFTCSHLGINKTMTNNASYIKNWIEALNNDHKYIFRASKLAENALKQLESEISSKKERVEV